jgi:hypothetical protein
MAIRTSMESDNFFEKGAIVTKTPQGAAHHGS